MKKELISRFISLFLRVAGMVARFALLLYLAKILEPSDLGLFGLFIATINFSILLLGGDFYTYSQRELLSKPKEEWSFILKNQVAATFILYIILLPLHFILFYFNILPVKYIIYFFLLLIAEHIAQEINRLVVAIQKPVIASFILFIRLGFWVVILIPALHLGSIKYPLEATFLFWIIGVTSAIFFGLYTIFSELKPYSPIKVSIDWAWIKKGLKVGFTFLIATLCFRALFTLDRYTVQYIAGANLLGVYVFYISIANALLGFIDAGILSFLYPRLVSSFKTSNMKAYKKYKLEMLISVFISCIFLSLLIALLVPVVLDWLNKDIYIKYLDLLWILLAVTSIYAIGMIPHYELYAQNQDKVIMKAHIMSLFIFFIFAALFFIFSPTFYATACGLLAAFIWMGLYKLKKVANKKQLCFNI